MLTLIVAFLPVVLILCRQAPADTLKIWDSAGAGSPSEFEPVGPLSECGKTRHLRGSWHFRTVECPKIITYGRKLFILGQLLAMARVRCRRLWDSKENPEQVYGIA